MNELPLRNPRISTGGAISGRAGGLATVAALPWGRKEFWQGCLAVLDPKAAADHDAITRIDTIMDGLDAGTGLEDIPEFWRWLGRPEFVIATPKTPLDIR